MIWPFKRAPEVPWDEVVKTFPPAPCGKQEDHYHWQKVEGMACPHCYVARMRRKEHAKEERIATLIAEKVSGKVLEALAGQDKG